MFVVISYNQDKYEVYDTFDGIVETINGVAYAELKSLFCIREYNPDNKMLVSYLKHFKSIMTKARLMNFDRDYLQETLINYFGKNGLTLSCNGLMDLFTIKEFDIMFGFSSETNYDFVNYGSLSVRNPELSKLSESGDWFIFESEYIKTNKGKCKLKHIRNIITKVIINKSCEVCYIGYLPTDNSLLVLIFFYGGHHTIHKVITHALYKVKIDDFSTFIKRSDIEVSDEYVECVLSQTRSMNNCDFYINYFKCIKEYSISNGESATSTLSFKLQDINSRFKVNTLYVHQ